MLKIKFPFLVSFFLFATPVFSQFTERQVSPGSNQLSDIFMVNASIGYAGGVDGIFKTSDGGQTWNLLPYFVSTLPTLDSIFFQAMNYHYLHFENEYVGYSAGWDALGNREIIIKTLDGGETWAIQHFVNPDPAPFQPLEERLKDIDWLSANRLVSVGYRGRILLTTDGGANWTVKDSHTSNNLEAVDFYDANIGMVAGAGVLLLTQDGGNSWAHTASSYSIKDLRYLSQTKIVAITSDGRILTSVDGGSSWSIGLFTSSYPLNDLNFLNSSVGFIAGDGILYKTEDGGQSWYTVYTTTRSIQSSSFLTLLDGYFVTRDGRVIMTHDGGAKTILAPTVSSMTPTAGKQGDLVTISGTNLENVTHVSFNGTPATYSYENGKIETYVPENATTGKIALSVPGGQTVYTGDFTVSLTPIVNSPNPYFHVRGFPLVLMGVNLQYVHTVTLDSRSVPFTFTGGKLSIPTEAGLLSREYQLELKSDYGTAILYSFPIHGVPNPRSIGIGTGLTGAAGMDLRVTGDHLRAITEIEFEGGVKTNAINTDNNYYSVYVIIPPGAKSGRIKIRHPFGFVSPHQSLTIIQPPQIDSIRPLAAKSGDRISIYGKNLTPYNEFASLKIAGTSASSFIPVSDTQIDFIVPFLQGTYPIELRLFGGKVVSTESLAVSGEQPYHILTISPMIVSNDQPVRVSGYFPLVDSVKLGSRKIPYSQYGRDVIVFRVPLGAVSGKISLFKNNVAIVSDSILIVSNNSSSTVGSIKSFYPTQAAPGASIYVTCGPLDPNEIKEFSINGVKIPYMPGGGIYPDYKYRLVLPAEVTTGKLMLKTKSNVFTTREELVIVPNAAPLIHAKWPYDDTQVGRRILVYGDNLEHVDSVFFDLIPAVFTRIHNDTLLVNVPRITEYGIDGARNLIVKSPYGVASTDYEVSYQSRLRDIIQVAPLEAKRGSEIIITLEPKRDDLPDNAYGQVYGFYFNGVLQRVYEKVDENQYRVRVPMEGDVNGKIGVRYHGNFMDIPYSALNFQVLEVTPCAAGGQGLLLASIVSMKLGQYENKSSFTSYSDFSASPIEVIPGQKLSLALKATTRGGSLGYEVAVYLDWNNDNDFNDVDEIILKAPNRVSSSNDTLMLFKVMTIPPGLTGNYRTKMRISVSTFGEPAVACGFVQDGEVEDYAIQVIPSAPVFKITDFYPKTTKPGARIMVVGDNLLQATSSNMTVGGVAPGQISYYNNQMIEVVVPENATTGKIILNDGQGGQIKSDKVLTLDPGLPIMEPATFNHLYRATINGEDIAFTYNTESFSPHHQIFPAYPNDVINGTLCVYGGTGSYCDPSGVTFLPVIKTVSPNRGVSGEKIIIQGDYLYFATTIRINGVNAVFTALSEDRIEVIVPAGASTGKISIVTINGSTTSDEDFTIPTAHCDPSMGVMSADIIKVQVEKFQNSSLLNEYPLVASRNCSDYRHLQIPAFSGEVLNVKIRTQGATHTLVKFLPSIYVDWNNDFDFDDTQEHYTNQDFLTMAYHSVDSGKIALTVPDYVNPGTKATMRIVLTGYYDLPPTLYDVESPCFSSGEMEEYTVSVLNKNEVALKPSISDFTPKVSTTGGVIQITGSNLSGVTSVNVNGSITSVTVINDTNARFTIPLRSTSGYFTLTDANNATTSPVPLEINPLYSISGFTPASGRQGDEVTVYGSNLSAITWVAFNGFATQDFTIVNSGQLRVRVPQGAGDGVLSVRSGNNPIRKSNEWFYYCDGLTASSHCKLNQIIYMNAFEPLSMGKVFPLVSVTSSGLPVTFTSSNTAIATVANGEVKPESIGTVVITATQPGNAQYYPALLEMPLAITKAQQVITFPTLPTKTYGDAPFTLSASSNSPYPIIFQSSNTSIASIVNNVVTIYGAGTVTITASRPETPDYQAATSVSRDMVVAKKAQTISFEAPTGKTYGDAAFDLTSSSTSGLPVSFTSSNPSIASVSGKRVTILAAGSVQFTASQSGNSNFYSATTVVQPFNIAKKNQSITFPAIVDKVVGTAPFPLVASSSSGLPVQFSSLSDKISISASVVSIIKPGAVTIRAVQIGNQNFSSATDQEQAFCINPLKPIITVSEAAHGRVLLSSSALTGNHWLLDGVEIPDADGNTYQPIASGEYTVVVQVDNCKSEPSQGEALIVTGAEENQVSLVQIYPNPAQSKLTVSLGSLNPAGITLDIHDVMGRLVKTTTATGDKTAIDISSFTQGQYVLRVSRGNSAIKHFTFLKR